MHNTWLMSAVELGYFADTPWGKVPEDRKGELVFESPRIPQGLLGGSSGQKSSKLAELARKRKEKAKASGPSTEEKTSITLLSRLSQKQPPPAKIVPEVLQPTSAVSQPLQSTSPTLKVHKPAVQKQKSKCDLDQPEREDAPIPDATVEPVLQSTHPVALASPSRFAKSIFGERITLQHEIGVADGFLFFVSGNNTPAKANAFAGPSPDDIVVAAQSRSKGVQRSSGFVQVF